MSSPPNREVCQFIQSVGCHLHFSEEVIANAIVYYLKFDRDGPKGAFDPYHVAATCLMLSSKVSAVILIL